MHYDLTDFLDDEFRSVFEGSHTVEATSFDVLGQPFTLVLTREEVMDSAFGSPWGDYKAKCEIYRGLDTSHENNCVQRTTYTPTDPPIWLFAHSFRRVANDLKTRIESGTNRPLWFGPLSHHDVIERFEDMADESLTEFSISARLLDVDFELTVGEDDFSRDVNVNAVSECGNYENTVTLPPNQPDLVLSHLTYKFIKNLSRWMQHAVPEPGERPNFQVYGK